MSLCAILQVDITTSLRQVRVDIDDLGNRRNYVETKMEEFASSFNALVDSKSDKGDYIVWNKVKHADLEDRSRKNNLKIRGVSESVLNDQRPVFIQSLLRSVLPNASPI